MFSDALSQAIYSHNYTQKDSESLTPEESAQIAYEVYEAWLLASESSSGGDCPDCVLPDEEGPFTRLNPDTGRPERLGTTEEQFGLWVPYWADDEWPESPDNYPAVAATHAEAVDPVCSAASNAVNALHTLLDGVFDLYADEVEPAVASSETAILVGATIGSLFYPPARAIIAGAEFGFAVFYDVMGHLTEDYWTDAFEEELTCIFKDNATLHEDGTVTFAYTVILWEMLSTLWTARAYVLLVAQVQYLLQIIGRDGLDAAGALAAVEGDCSSCDVWCFTTTPAAMFTITQGFFNSYGAIVENNVGGAWKYDMSLVVDTSECVITRLQHYSQQTSYTGYRNISALPSDGPINQQFVHAGGGTLVFTTDDNAAWASNSDTTTIRFWKNTDSVNHNAQCYNIKIWGTGKNPFGASNC